MANELQIGLSLTFNKGGASVQKAETFNVDVTGEAYESGTVTTTNDTAVDLANGVSTITNVGFVYIKLLSVPTASTYLKWGFNNSVTSGKLKAGESCILRMPDTEENCWIKASAAENVVVEYILIED